MGGGGSGCRTYRDGGRTAEERGLLYVIFTQQARLAAQRLSSEGRWHCELALDRARRRLAEVRQHARRGGGTDAPPAVPPAAGPLDVFAPRAQRPGPALTLR